MTLKQSPELFISVVLPCFNEAANIKDVIEDVSVYLKKFNKSEIVVVDDGSTDSTQQILGNLTANYPTLKIIRFAKNQGLSAALLAGCKEACGDFIVTMDADSQYRAKSIDTLIKEFANTDIVCGYRLNRSDGLIKKITSVLGNYFGDLITGDTVLDSGCLLRFFPKKVINEINVFDGFHRFFVTLCRIKGYSVLEVGVAHFPRTKGYSKFNTSNRVFTSFCDAIAVRRLRKKEARCNVL